MSDQKAIDQSVGDFSGQCESLVGTVPGVVYSLNENGRFTFLSSSAASYFGFSKEDLSGRHFSTIIHPVDIQSVSREFILPRFEGVPTGNDRAPKLFDERRSWPRKTSNLQVRIRPKHEYPENESPTLLCKVNASGHYDRNGRFLGTVGIMYDIAEDEDVSFPLGKRHHYNAFELMTQALSHVFSNVFTGIYGNLQLIEMQLESPERFSDNIEAIKHSVENAVTLIRKLAKMVASSEGGSIPGLQKLLSDTADELLGGIGMRYRCDINSNLWQYESDPDYIGHIIRAVFFHIARSVAGSGVVSVVAANVSESPVKLPRVDCAYVRVGIEYPLLPEVQRISAIEEFSSLERVASMALSYELLKKIGGILSVNANDRLSEIQLYLPAVRGS